MTLLHSSYVFWSCLKIYFFLSANFSNVLETHLLILLLQCFLLLTYCYHVWNESCALQRANECKIIWMCVTQQVLSDATDRCQVVIQ